MEAVDKQIPQPTRDLDKPFLMPVEDMSMRKRNSGNRKSRRGIVKVGDEIEIVGMKETQETTVTGVEIFGKL